MKKFERLLEKAESHVDEVKSITEPLASCFGLDHFSHFRLTRDGKLTNLSNSPDRTHYFFDNDLYLHTAHLYKAPDQPVSRSLLSADPKVQKGLAKVPDTLMWHEPFMLRYTDDDGTLDSFTFAASRQLFKGADIYFNNLPLLERFVRHFLESTSHIQNDLAEDSVDIFDLVQKAESSEDPTLSLRQIEFLRRLGVDARLLAAAQKLTRRERQVLRGLAEGKTAQGIGQALHLSKRTIEYYIDILKNKLDIHRKPQLISVALLFADLGLI